MFLEFFRFELRLRLKSLSTYCYFFLWALIGFLSVGASDFGPVGAGKLLLNGPFAIAVIYSQLCFFGIIVMAAIFGTSILRDFQRDTVQLIFTKPIGKFAYLGGRWAGSLVITVLIFLGIPLGMILGGFAPWADHARIAPVNFHWYFGQYLTIVVPQLFFLGSLFFLVAALTRRVVVVYLQGVALFAIYLVGLIAVQNTRSLKPFWPAVLDPVGLLLLNSVTRYWTPVERNTLVMPLTDMFLYNRLLWIGVGVLALIATYFLFPMSAETLGSRRSRKAKKVEQEKVTFTQPRPAVRLPRVQQIFGGAATWAQFMSLARIRTKNIVREVPFWAIGLIMIVFCAVNGYFAGRSQDANVWPVTYLMLEAVEGGSFLFLLIVAAMYAGELIWRERDTHFEQIHDTLPSPKWLDWLSKLTALAVTELLLLTIVMLTGIVMQTVQGYYHYELLQYFKELYLVTFPQILAFALFALFIQTVVANKFIGHGIAIGMIILVPVLERQGWQNRLYTFGDLTPYTYSDMNGYGHFVHGLIWTNIYWLAITGLLGVAAIALARQGTDTSLRHRLTLAKQALPRLAPAIVILLAIAVGSGAWIYYNFKVLNHYRTDVDVRRLQAGYEKLYKKYEMAPQPKIYEVETKVEIYPERRAFSATGHYMLQNRTDVPISDIYVSDQNESVKEVSFDRPSNLAQADKKYGFFTYHLEQPLAPGDSLRMNFRCGKENLGFRNTGELAQFAYNGTFFDSDYFPYLGYNRNNEIDNPVRRREQGLGPLEELAPRGDPYWKNVNLFSPQADWITYHTVVGTSGDQIAIAPGYLQKQWTENGRNYFEYSMGSTRIADFFSYLSGRYAVRRDQWNDVTIEIYYLPEHNRDLDKMVEASKRGLEYYTQNYGPYQFKQYRIIEFPRYRGFAQSFPNTVPYSESIGFIGRLIRPDDIDFTYFVTAHELAHQWWGHQLIGGQVKGSNMMSESLAEYSALRVMQHKYGDEHMRRFLSHELDGYLRGRSGEVRHEPPLVLVDREPYVWYQKGSLVLYGLSDYIGEDNLNRALSTFLQAHKYSNPPYPDTQGFVDALKTVTPAALQYLIADMFESITLYDNKTTKATWQETPDHKYKVVMNVESRKVKANGDGVEQPVPLHDLIEVGVFSGTKDHEKPLHVEKVWLSQPKTTLEFVVDEKPTRAGIDPYSKLIDRNPEDNVVDIDKAP